MTDGCDLGVRLEEWRLVNGPIRSSYSTLPHHNVDALFLISHLLSKQNNKQQAAFLLLVLWIISVVFTFTCTRGNKTIGKHRSDEAQLLRFVLIKIIARCDREWLDLLAFSCTVFTDCFTLIAAPLSRYTLCIHCVKNGDTLAHWLWDFDGGSKLLIFFCFFKLILPSSYAVIEKLLVFFICQQMNHQSNLLSVIRFFGMPVKKPDTYWHFMICRAWGREVVLTPRDAETLKDLFIPARMI